MSALPQIPPAACSQLELTGNFSTPCYIIDLERLRYNNAVHNYVAQKSGASVLAALKAYSCWKTFDILGDGLSGCCASSLHEARLGHEKFASEVHIFSPAYKPEQIAEYKKYCSHFSFNSLSQWQRFKEVMSETPKISCGLRLNPQHRETETDMYDPCGKFSRLGITLTELEKAPAHLLEGIEGLHVHTLCEKFTDAFERTLAVVEEKFGHLLHKMKWLNCGGGHLVTSPGYDIEKLISLLANLREKYDLQVYIEPGESHVRDAAVLVTEVVDITHNEMDIAILDTSAATHMPDVLEMPYRPDIFGADEAGAKPHTYRLGGPSCLAGDVIGDYSFDQPLEVGSRLIFADMGHYTMVKNTTFNGIALPSIHSYDPLSNELVLLKDFGYDDFLNRLS